jgi:hypothetical protein
MPYKVSLTLLDGEQTHRSEIYQGPTPNLGDRISAAVGNGSTFAKVTGIRKNPSKSPGTTVETADTVDAQEL